MSHIEHAVGEFWRRLSNKRLNFDIVINKVNLAWFVIDIETMNSIWWSILINCIADFLKLESVLQRHLLVGVDILFRRDDQVLCQADLLSLWPDAHARQVVLDIIDDTVWAEIITFE